MASFKNGDLGRIIQNTTNHNFPIGTIVRCKGSTSGRLSGYFEWLDGHDGWAVYFADLEPIGYDNAVGKELRKEVSI